MIIVTGNTTAPLEKFLSSMQVELCNTTHNWDKLKELYGENLKAIVINKNFWDAAQEISSDRKETYALAVEIKNNYEQSLVRLNDLKIEYKILEFPNFLFEYKKTYNTLQKLGIHFNEIAGMEMWQKTIDTKNYKFTVNNNCSEKFLGNTTHNKMILSQTDAIELTTIKDKITAIIPTFSSPLDCFMWTIFSYLLNTAPNDALEHIIVCINGADDRTHDVSNQDKKQRFLEELRNLKWYHTDNPLNNRDMPLTVIRAWSRIGHPESVEMALPWVHTDNYLISHDDIIITKDFWIEEVKEKFLKDPEAAIAHFNPLMCALCDTAVLKDKNLLRFPHLLCTFLVCKKKYLDPLNSSWCGFHVEMPDFKIDDLANFEVFYEFQTRNNSLNWDALPRKDYTYNFISMEMGAWHFYNLKERNLKFIQLDPELIVHFGAMSWDSEERKTARVKEKFQWAEKIEQKILAHPEYSKLYRKYKDKPAKDSLFSKCL